MQIITPYGLNTLPIKRLSLEEPPPQNQTSRSTTTQSSIQSMQNPLRNGRCSFLFATLIVHTTIPTISTKIFDSTSVNIHLPISPLIFNKSIRTIPLTLPPLYRSNFSPTYFCVQPSEQSTSKIFSVHDLFSQFRLRQRTTELWSLVSKYTALTSLFFLKVWTVITGLNITDFLSFRLIKLVYCR